MNSNNTPSLHSSHISHIVMFGHIWQKPHKLSSMVGNSVIKNVIYLKQIFILRISCPSVILYNHFIKSVTTVVLFMRACEFYIILVFTLLQLINGRENTLVCIFFLIVLSCYILSLTKQLYNLVFNVYVYCITYNIKLGVLDFSYEI